MSGGCRNEWARFAALQVLSSAIASCASREEPPRPQVLMVVDTDAPRVGQIASDPRLSLDAAIDTLRVEVLDGADFTADFRNIVAPERGDWPLSFGIAPDAGADQVTIRIRAFRGARATSGQLKGVSVPDPLAEISIDRLVNVRIPGDGPRVARVELAEACMGTRAVFAPDRATCVTAGAYRGSPIDGVEWLPYPESNRVPVAVWPSAVEQPCAAPPAAERICIPGGFSVLGDYAFAGATTDFRLDPKPLVPVLSSPFWIDKTEYTVGRLRAALRNKALQNPEPGRMDAAMPNRRFCTWLGPDDAINDAFPLNCVEWATARELCELDGGMLPSEAQWEHAARGRGQSRRYPWGDEPATCCTASVSRRGYGGEPIMCEGVGSSGGVGIEPVGSHTDRSACASADVSRDGVVDLGGSMSEMTRDGYRSYDDPCWQGEGILRDPTCAPVGASANHPMRGGCWNCGPVNAASVLRSLATSAETVGFRCVYGDATP